MALKNLLFPFASLESLTRNVLILKYALQCALCFRGNNLNSFTDGCLNACMSKCVLGSKSKLYHTTITC